MLKELLKFIFLFIISISVFLLPLKTKALSPGDIFVNIVPENPTPGENTNITLNSYAINLNGVLISWSVDGKTVSSGVGKKTFSLKAPGAGKETNVIASVSQTTGQTEVKAVIRPNVLVLLWQTDDSYVPPFYKGKAMSSPGSQVKVVAMPEIRTGSQMVNPKNMTYAWKKDYTNNPDGSGYGKSSFVYTSDYLDDSNNISVTASTIDQKYSSEKSLDIGMTQPKIIFYKNDPILGTVWEQSLQNGHKIVGDEIIEASPYFISPKDIRIPVLTWNWFINDSMVNTTGTRKNLMPLKTQLGVSGTATVKLELENIYKLFENASGEISVEF